MFSAWESPSLDSVLGLITTTACFLIGLIVYIKGPERPVNRWYGAALACMTLWTFDNFLFLAFPTARFDMLHRWVYIGPVLSQYCYIWLAVSVVGGKRGRQAIVIRAMSVWAALLVAASLAGMFFHPAQESRGIIGYSVPTAFYASFVLYVVVSGVAGTAILINGHRETGDAPLKMRISYILWAALTMYAAGTMYFLSAYGFTIPPIWIFSFELISVLLIAYAILKHQLMDVAVVIGRTAAYTTTVAVASLLYLVSVFFIHETIFVPSGTTSITRNLIGLAVVAVFFKPIDIAVHRIFERWFFKGTLPEIIRQKERLETEVERRERLKSVGILAAGMAHELKNPLTSIKTFVERLPEKYDDPVFREKFCRILGGEIGRMTAIVSDLLAFSKPAEPKREPCSLDRLLREILELIGPRLVSAGVKVEADLREATAFADKEQMRQALLNLLMNAVDSMSAVGGMLAVVSRQSNGRAEVEVKDQGCGMAPETLKHVFDPFFTTKEGGTGMGLAVTHSIVERNGGRITVQSALNQGTTFTLNLPA